MFLYSMIGQTRFFYSWVSVFLLKYLKDWWVKDSTLLALLAAVLVWRWNLSLLSMMMPRSFPLSSTGIVCVLPSLSYIIRWGGGGGQLSFGLPIHITLHLMMLSLRPRFERFEVKNVDVSLQGIYIILAVLCMVDLRVLCMDFVGDT